MENKTALITAGAKRIGKEIALFLDELGYNVIIHYNKSQKEAVCLEKKLKNAKIITADFSKENEINKFIKKANDLFGSIDILINNASIFENDNMQNISYNSLLKNFNINCFAPTIISKEFAKLKNANEQGIIINISDQKAFNPTSNYSSYSLSKMMLNEATRLLAKEYAPNIRVNAIALGMVLKAQNQNVQSHQNILNNSLLKKQTKQYEINNLIELIIKSPSMTGEIIKLDSGMSIS